jgi:hypothetical protein
MRYTSSLLPIFVAAALAGPSALRAQTVEGRVIDPATERPIAEATVAVLTESGRVVAQTVGDTAGNFVVALRGPGEYRLRADRIGYRRVTSQGFTVGPREALKVDLHLSAGAVELAPLVITSRPEPPRVLSLERSGFYERERHSPGVFMRREDVNRSRGMRMSDVLATIPGVRRATVQGRSAISLGRSGMGSRVCAPAVFIDGQPLVRPESIDDIVHVAAIEALEVYRGPSQTPARFAGQESGCGVVVIWTQQKV